MIDFVEKLCDQLKIVKPKQEKNKSYKLSITDDLIIYVWELTPGFHFNAEITLLPKENKELIVLKLMKANLLGRGTGKNIIGLDDDEKFLTMSCSIDYEIDYGEFKEKLEDFVNYIYYWRKEIESYKQKTNIL